MTHFRTILPVFNSKLLIQHEQKLLALGSCFAEHIGERLHRSKFKILQNPFGILYHPIPIADNLSLLIGKELIEAKDLVQHQGLWHSFRHHGEFSKPSKDDCLKQINEQLKIARKRIEELDCLLLTFGTAIGYSRGENFVANCHKFPSNIFEQKLVSQKEILALWKPLINKLLNKRPSLKIILSVSPVRHLRNGFIENQKSKAQLILAAHELSENFKQIHYFPSYEIMMDDLRDYRFYKDDLVHPSKQAIEYIWNYFQETFFNENTKKTIEKLNKLEKSLNHRPLHPERSEHQLFLKKQLKKVLQLEKEFSNLNFEKEKIYFQKSQIKNA